MTPKRRNENASRDHADPSAQPDRHDGEDLQRGPDKPRPEAPSTVSIRKSCEWAWQWPAWPVRMGDAAGIADYGVSLAAEVAVPRHGGLRGGRSRAGSFPGPGR